MIDWNILDSGRRFRTYVILSGSRFKRNLIYNGRNKSLRCYKPFGIKSGKLSRARQLQTISTRWIQMTISKKIFLLRGYSAKFLDYNTNCTTLKNVIKSLTSGSIHPKYMICKPWTKLLSMSTKDWKDNQKPCNNFSKSQQQHWPMKIWLKSSNLLLQKRKQTNDLILNQQLEASLSEVMEGQWINEKLAYKLDARNNVIIDLCNKICGWSKKEI